MFIYSFLMSHTFLLLSSTLTLILAARSFNSKLRNNVSIAPNRDVLLIQLQGGKGLFCFESIRRRSFWMLMQWMMGCSLVVQTLCLVQYEGTSWPSLTEHQSRNCAVNLDLPHS